MRHLNMKANTVAPAPPVGSLARACQRRHWTEALNLLLAAIALPAAFLLRFEAVPSPVYQQMLGEALPWAIAIKLLVFRGFSLRDLAWRYLGFQDLLRITGANLAASLLLTAVLLAKQGSAFPRSIYILDWLLSIVLLTLARAAARLWRDWRQGSSRGRVPGNSRRVLIYGAGEAGRRVLAEVRAHPEMQVDAVGFADDDPAKKHLRISGLKVRCGREDLSQTVRRLGVDQVWIATPAATGAEIAAILENCHSARVQAKRIPPLTELVESKVLVDQLREVHLEDLLGRPPVRWTGEEGRWLRGQTVLVTGAGGSIGSELCRQIARARPKALVGLDHAENALYQIDQELRQEFPGVEFHAEIASIQNPRRIEEIMALYTPEVVYHAAAYKHVPLMEAHIFEAIENNVFGTDNLARAAAAAGVAAFVLVSSDKAVRPANIMGATKRLAELVCLDRTRADEFAPAGRKDATAISARAYEPVPRAPASGGRSLATRFMAVRFGNVLGSSGSVIPLFRRQIAAGGPVTVTHPDMRRYFMTIPEAVQLVLRTAELGSGGEVFVLDMGEPVKIVDLARKMVLLSGLRPGEDIQIEFRGMRPGEKLSEELHLAEEDTMATPHPKIRVYRSAGESRQDVNIGELRRGVAARDFAATLLSLKEIVPDYSPSAAVLRRALASAAPLHRRAANA